MEELEDGSYKSRASLSLAVTSTRDDQLIIRADHREQLIVPRAHVDHQLIVECTASHPQLGRDRLSYAHTLQIFSRFSLVFFSNKQLYYV